MVSGSSVYAVLTDDRYIPAVNEVVSLDSGDGKEKWRVGGYDQILMSFRNSVSLLDTNGNVVNCSASDGSQLWSLPTSVCDNVAALDGGMLLVYGQSGLLQRIQIRR